MKSEVKTSAERLNQTLQAETLTLGFNPGEIYLRFGDVVIVVPPSTAKQLIADLKLQHLPDDPKPLEKRVESVPKRVIRALFKSRKVNKSLVSVNTGRRKKLPDS
jgi:hypothetical protein